MFEILRDRRAFGRDQSGRDENRSGANIGARAASMRLHNILPLWAPREWSPAKWTPTQMWPLTRVIRHWRQRARARQQLRRLSDHMLKDIGLSREEVGHEFPWPFGRFD